MHYGSEKPKLSFLKSLGLQCLCEKRKFQADKLEPKADKCIFIEYPKQLGVPLVSDLEVNRSFLEKKVSLERIEWEDGGDLMR